MKALDIIEYTELALTEVTSSSIVEVNNILISSEITFYVEDSVDLSVIQAVDNSVNYVHEKLAYHITVINNGTENSSNVTLIDTLPLDITLSSISLSQGTYSYSNGKIICYLNILTSHSRAFITITVIPKSCGVIKNTASVQCLESDRNLNNNLFTKVVKIYPNNTP